MISKQEIINSATNMSLTPHVVEKDFALGWILAGIYANEKLTESWIFKGGTCLKKCYFETYRFSEDLDFTLTDENHLDEGFLRTAFKEVADWVYNASGIEMPADGQKFDIYTNPRGSISCQGKLPYLGPVSPRSGGMPRIKIDLTCDERVVLAPVRRPVFHPYSDEPESKIYALSYCYEEVFGEKVRALAERTRPRDLYDVINLFRNDNEKPAPAVLLDVIRQKCEFKHIGLPKLAELEQHRDDLTGSWHGMLDHQLPALPSVDDFWAALGGFFDWLYGIAEPVQLSALPNARDDTVVRDRMLPPTLSSRSQPILEIVRFAAANRLCVELTYRKENGEITTPRIEPYSLRRSNAGNISLHGFDVHKSGNRSYRIDRIIEARVTSQSFTPRYEVELIANGPVNVPPTTPRTVGFGAGRRLTTRQAPMRARAAKRSSYAANYGPKYIYQCPVCQKKFTRKKRDPKLNKHKNNWGGQCSGRRALLLETKF
ncbi:MAG: WYL domain-containing protein [Sphingomonadales bacterium]|nr:WYL domain-containing protein [Sphingomonadales bacterium]